MARPAATVPVAVPEGFSVRLLAHDEDAVLDAARVVATAFGSPFVEEQGHIRSRIERGLNVTAVAQDADGAVVGVATLQPIGDVAELVGAAVLPAQRRRGLGGALLSLLLGEADRRGVDVLLLSASEDGLGLYRSLGFAEVGTLAEAPPD
jgi:ribosomal protein S18 acetylase RimI-like enzyme